MAQPMYSSFQNKYENLLEGWYKPVKEPKKGKTSKNPIIYTSSHILDYAKAAFEQLETSKPELSSDLKKWDSENKGPNLDRNLHQKAGIQCVKPLHEFCNLLNYISLLPEIGTDSQSGEYYLQGKENLALYFHGRAKYAKLNKELRFDFFKIQLFVASFIFPKLPANQIPFCEEEGKEFFLKHKDEIAGVLKDVKIENITFKFADTELYKLLLKLDPIVQRFFQQQQKQSSNPPVGNVWRILRKPVIALISMIAIGSIIHTSTVVAKSLLKIMKFA